MELDALIFLQMIGIFLVSYSTGTFLCCVIYDIIQYYKKRKPIDNTHNWKEHIPEYRYKK